jgi:hypothetical protein
MTNRVSKPQMLRKDISTGKMVPANELIRVVRTKDQTVVVDSTKQLNGRGVYLAPNLDALRIVQQKKLIQRNLRCEVPAELFTALEAEIVNN